MGTTVVAVSEWEDKLIVAHVGDSRIYRFRDGRLEQVTRDHSLLNHKIDLGELQSQDEIDNFKHGNVIVRAIGLKDYVRPETAIHERIPGDVYLLCSDGLSDMVDDWSIENVLEANYDDLDEAARILIRMANDRGGKDNITAVLVRVDDEPEPVEEYEYEEEGLPLARREESTQPGRAAFDDEEQEPAPTFKEFGVEDDDKTAPHSPVFAWADDDDEDDTPISNAQTRPAARPQPAPRPQPTDTRRRTQPTEELPSIIVEDDDEPASAFEDARYRNKR
jgi:hypothetical protein